MTPYNNIWDIATEARCDNCNVMNYGLSTSFVVIFVYGSCLM
jgi:hypothetical protein